MVSLTINPDLAGLALVGTGIAAPWLVVSLVRMAQVHRIADRARKIKRRVSEMANAVQISKKSKGGGSTHAVGLGDLRVLLVQEGDVWYAQGLEIDYVAQGASLEGAQSAFERGLALTIREHLKLFGDIQRLLTPAPRAVWDEFFQHGEAGQYRFTTFTKHALSVSTEDVFLDGAGR